MKPSPEGHRASSAIEESEYESKPCRGSPHIGSNPSAPSTWGGAASTFLKTLLRKDTLHQYQRAPEGYLKVVAPLLRRVTVSLILTTGMRGKRSLKARLNEMPESYAFTGNTAKAPYRGMNGPSRQALSATRSLEQS